jgi:DNA-binding NarL/FixJ family response regulator
MSDPRYNIWILLQLGCTVKEIAEELALNINLVKKIIDRNIFRLDDEVKIL